MWRRLCIEVDWSPSKREWLTMKEHGNTPLRHVNEVSTCVESRQKHTDSGRLLGLWMSGFRESSKQQYQTTSHSTLHFLGSLATHPASVKSIEQLRKSKGQTHKDSSIYSYKEYKENNSPNVCTRSYAHTRACAHAHTHTLADGVWIGRTHRGRQPRMICITGFSFP